MIRFNQSQGCFSSFHHLRLILKTILFLKRYRFARFWRAPRPNQYTKKNITQKSFIQITCERMQVSDSNSILIEGVYYRKVFDELHKDMSDEQGGSVLKKVWRWTCWWANDSPRLRAGARKVRFWNSLRWPIIFIISVAKIKFSRYMANKLICKLTQVMYLLQST